MKTDETGKDAARPRRRCLFLAPLKPADHPTPSGDRLIARQFLRLLDRIGFEVDVASTLRTRCATPDALPEIAAAAAAELARCLTRERAQPAAERAELVFTYHNYYKAPDLVGPALAAGLGIPYVIAESSRSPRRAEGPWAQAHALAEAASDAAALILTPTARDAVMLEQLRPPDQQVVRLRPFIDLSEWPAATAARPARKSATIRLLTVAMMRPGVKIASYERLAAALALLCEVDWQLDIVGDGEGRSAVEALFKHFGERVTFHGAVADRTRLGAFYRDADVFVWPGVGEAFGMVYLEAQAHGLPCLAYRYGGVAEVITEGASGYAVSPDDEPRFLALLARLITDAPERERIRLAARRQVERFHSFDAASRTVLKAFQSLDWKAHALSTTG
jgi:glycosyltransferase involved in cell wall biosynthesis